MLGLGRGRWAVAQILILIRKDVSDYLILTPKTIHTDTVIKKLSDFTISKENKGNLPTLVGCLVTNAKLKECYY